MRFETKHNIGDRVYIVQSETVNERKKCDFCDGSGEIASQATNKTRSCPECIGKGEVFDKAITKHCVKGPMTVGKISIEHTHSPGIDGEKLFDNYKKQGPATKETYMLVETGIGSGYVYEVARVFCSGDEALAECEKLNTIDAERDGEPC